MDTALPDRSLLNDQTPHYLSRGRLANSDVRLIHIDNQAWVVKDFSACPFFIKQTVGRLMIRREVRALQLLSDIPGVPQNVIKIDSFALAYHYVEGRPLTSISSASISLSFFLAFEHLVQALHRRGIAHLDLRNSGNVLMDEHGLPVIIDFQSWIFLPLWLPFLAYALRLVDLSGVYKLWNNLMPGTMGQRRQQLLSSVNRWRKGWIFSNYFGLRRFFKARK